MTAQKLDSFQYNFIFIVATLAIHTAQSGIMWRGRVSLTSVGKYI